jgi:hypothetical protein
MSENPKGENETVGNNAVLQAATAMPVIEGALAFIVIGFVGQAWDSIPAELGRQAFVLVYASGAHFLFSFLFAVPAMVICRHNDRRQFAIDFGLLAGLFAYVFWSLNEQHRELANLLIDPPWQIPLPLGNELSSLLQAISGGPDYRLFLSPLIFAWIVAAIVGAVLWLPSAAVRRANKTKTKA